MISRRTLLISAVGSRLAAKSGRHFQHFRKHAMLSTFEKVAENLQFPEGPAWNGRDALFCSNCSADYITRVDLHNNSSIAFRAGDATGTFRFEKTNGMTFYQDGSLVACDFGRNAIVRIKPSGVCSEVARTIGGRPLEAPNDLAFDPHGNLYVTCPGGSGKANPVGRIYRIAHGANTVSQVAADMAFPNGLAFSADGKVLFVAESQHNRIVRFRVNDDGSLGDLEPFADLSPAGNGEPDGLNLDIAGNLWIAHYGAHQVLVVDTSGHIAKTIPLAHNSDGGPTNVEFGGPQMDLLFVTDPGAACLWRAHVDTPGLRLFCSPKDQGY
ncbi:MAG: SMP-30/gluconolactonase/LRE family protein [Armatimonadetes bacterium]|nr:SMP-30/gluconolactonase/LRE family protein [Armatimonadota bacterium]MDE2205390.1 SMP-30/gluconolactonase/LRE family protein [Armatimonadota bacterium]